MTLACLPSEWKTRAWLLLGTVEQKVYCRYEGEYSQRHLEGSRLNWTMMGMGMGLRGEGREEAGAKRPAACQENKRLVAKIADLI